ncbi:hypothetical protein F5Y19DRAFT_410209 [Xylariaceae sp. FL1651]|nr:hypothetical protein F5Y19DRAFT_410209 [Xylariaceae sp. FL1651]
MPTARLPTKEGFAERQKLSTKRRVQMSNFTQMSHFLSTLQKRYNHQLHRFLVPASPRFLELRNLAFTGMHRSVHAVVIAQAQTLWINAFFEGNIALDPEIVCYETILHTKYERLRRPRERERERVEARVSRS